MELTSAAANKMLKALEDEKASTNARNPDRERSGFFLFSITESVKLNFIYSDY